MLREQRLKRTWVNVSKLELRLLDKVRAIPVRRLRPRGLLRGSVVVSSPPPCPEGYRRLRPGIALEMVIRVTSE